MAIEILLLIASVLILLSIGIARLSDSLGVPVLVLFLGIGMLAGSEGPGGIFFDNAGLAQSIGIVCLIFILFAGGLDTHWSEVRPVFWPASLLASFGTLITAAAVGIFTHVLAGVSLLNGMLLGAIVSSTDAAAVFSVLRSRNISLKGNLKPLLELESGSNDPMAVFLTVGIIDLMLNPEKSGWSIVPLFILQMGVGGLFGIGFGRLMKFILNHARLPYDGLYPVFALAFAILTYSGTAAVGGSGFLAVYVAGILAGRGNFIHRKSLVRFFDGLAWLSQIGMFVTLGLLVFPSQIIPTIGFGLMVSGFLMLVARPLSVFISLSFAPFNWREKMLVSWVGLRGAVPIILATFPLLANLPEANLLFNLVFFIVLTSALLQGWSIPYVASVLGMNDSQKVQRPVPLEFTPPEGVNADLVDFIIPSRSSVIGQSIVNIGLPPDTLVVLVGRGNEYIMPSGGTMLQEGDTLLALVGKEQIAQVREIVTRVDTG